MGGFAEGWTLVATMQKVEKMPRMAVSVPEEVAESSGRSIVVRDLRAWYGTHQAIGGVGLDIAPRQVTAIIGPSGCGKSTLIRCLNRMHEVTPGARAEGTVELNGVNMYGSGVDPVQVRRVVGMVFQKPIPDDDHFSERGRRVTVAGQHARPRARGDGRTRLAPVGAVG
jgi:ABC-type multidrug transport system fused ATPase/permease subunit